MPQKRELIKGSIDSLLLCLLAKQPMYGYLIIKELTARSQGYFQFKEGTLYPALHRLEQNNWVRSTWEMLPSGRQRKYYSITEKGLAVLGDRKSQWREYLTAMSLIIQPAET